MSRYPEWIEEVFASNMAYQPRSRPNFPTDRHHDVRDAMLAARGDTVAMWTGQAAEEYLAACRMLAIRDDPIADSLETFNTFDLASFAVAHDVMAAHWRHRHLPEFLANPDLDISELARFDPEWFERYRGFHLCPSAILVAFRCWLVKQTVRAARNDPTVIRLICLVLVQQNTASGFMAEIDLVQTLRARYPIPTIPPS